MNCILISIIIPHKNRPTLLRKCLESIPFQDNIEVIIVDDNSNTDIVDFDDFPGLNKKNIKVVFDKAGKGGGYARNIGLKQATGKWILFADSDDFFEPNLANTLKEYSDSDYDIVFYKARSIDLDSGLPAKRHGNLNKYIDVAIHSGNFDHLRYEVAYPICKLIKRNLIQNHQIEFEEIPNGNDVFFSLKIGLSAKKVLAVPKSIYVITGRKEHDFDITKLTVYRNLYFVFARKMMVLNKIKLGKYGRSGLLSFWGRILRANRKEANKLAPEVIRLTGFTGVAFIIKMNFFEYLARIKSRFPKAWQFTKSLKI